MSHRIIYIEKCECLKLYLDNIKVIYNDNDILLPISDIQILVIDNYKSSLSIPLINKLTENISRILIEESINDRVYSDCGTIDANRA